MNAGRTTQNPVPAPALPESQRGYLPRDVINAPQIKAAIEARSRAREDSDDVRQWLTSHFFRWAVGSFEHASRIADAHDYQRAAGPGSVPPGWLVKRWQAATGRVPQAGQPASAAPAPSSFHIDPAHPLLVDRERVLIEFLRAREGTRLEGKLQRINCFTALALWEEEHRRMQKRRSKGWVPSSGQALRELVRTPNGILFEFDGQHPALREEMAYESFHMQHCLGQFARMDKLTGGYGEGYAQDVQQGRARLFTLRSAGNQPHVTISLHVLPGRLRIDQIKGKQNRHPVRRYADDVLQFLRLLDLPGDRNPDCEGMGIVHEPAPDDARPGETPAWKFITEVRDMDFLLSAMHANFHLIEHFEHPSAALQWLLLRLAPQELGQLRHIDPAVAAAARLALTPEHWPAALQLPVRPAQARTQRWRIEGVPIDPMLCAPVRAQAPPAAAGA